MTYRIFAAAFLSLLLANCGASGVPSGGASVSTSLRVSLSDNRAPAGSNLLYASGEDCSVYVFTYPGGKLVQTLDACTLGFGPAFGLCSDRTGNVFMAMGEGFSVFEFAHGGTEPTAQLEDFSLLPVGCSVNPNTGDLGVASATGNVAIYKHASGTPQIFSVPDITTYFFCTFDGRGNLFADGRRDDGSFALVELPKGGSTLREITFSGKAESGMGIQWDGHYIAIETAQTKFGSTIDRIRISGLAAKIVGTTTLAGIGNAFIPFQFWIQGGRIVQPENGNQGIGLWSYPLGSPVEILPTNSSTLVGVTVSVAP